MSEIEQIQQRVSNWVDQFIISLNLCPFAQAVFPTGTHIEVCTQSELEPLYQSVLQQLNKLAACDNQQLATTLVVFPHALSDFDDFLDFLDVCEHMLEQSGMQQHFQIAPFHPKFQFESSDTEADTSVYTNISPYPIFHLLRAEEVEKVLTHDSTAEIIVKRNHARLAQLGEEYLQHLLQQL